MNWKTKISISKYLIYHTKKSKFPKKTSTISTIYDPERLSSTTIPPPLGKPNQVENRTRTVLSGKQGIPMNNPARHSNLRRKLVIQKRQRLKLNEISNLLDDLLWGLSHHKNELQDEDCARLLRISTTLRSIAQNQGTLNSLDFECWLGQQNRELNQLLSDTSSWHTAQSENEPA